jgi:multiple sugar transport system substrate-binding protein
VARLSARCGQVALSLAGPHAFLSLLSIATAFAEPAAPCDPDQLCEPEVGRASVELMIELAARTPRQALALNPIALLEHMATGSDLVLCPLVYGYVNYAAPGAGRNALRFVDAPRRFQGGRPGSTLGGTGIGISRRCAISPALLDHLRWLMSAPAQDQFIPAHEGQPSRRSAWSDPELDARWGRFYSNTAATLEVAYVRPRYAGYIAFQAAASAYLRAGLQERRPAAALASGLLDMHRRSLSAAGRGERAHA